MNMENVVEIKQNFILSFHFIFILFKIQESENQLKLFKYFLYY